MAPFTSTLNEIAVLTLFIFCFVSEPLLIAFEGEDRSTEKCSVCQEKRSMVSV